MFIFIHRKSKNTLIPCNFNLGTNFLRLAAQLSIFDAEALSKNNLVPL